MFKLLSRIRANSKQQNASANIESQLNHPPFEDVIESDNSIKSGCLMLSFEDVLKRENSLSKSDLERFASLYSDELLDKYKTTFTRSGPIFSYDILHKRLIDALPDSSISKIKPFHAIGIHAKERPIISFGNHCEYRTMDCLALNYSHMFLEYVLHRLSERVQYILLTVYHDYIHCPLNVDFIALDFKFHLKHKNDKNPAFVELLHLTGGFKPKIVKATVTEDIKYDHATFA